VPGGWSWKGGTVWLAGGGGRFGIGTRSNEPASGIHLAVGLDSETHRFGLGGRWTQPTGVGLEPWKVQMPQGAEAAFGKARPRMGHQDWAGQSSSRTT
jgi:hypothetical protein